MGFLIAIDGLDGSGKETQTTLLASQLKATGHAVRTLSFPVYESESSSLVRMYLNGALGENPADTGAYAASMLFAADRYVSYRTDWKQDVDQPGNIVLANRYTTANAVHQLSKLPEQEWDDFLTWLMDFEFVKLGLPTPDLVFYLELLPEISLSLVEKRSHETGREKDIHEKDRDFIFQSYRAALYASEKLGWKRIHCYDENGIRSIDSIAQEIWETLQQSAVITQ